MNTKIITLLMAIALLTTACNGRRKSHGDLLTPQSSGNPYEVMVVAPDSVYDGTAGKAIQKVLDRSILGLPQPEQMFRKSHVIPEHFDHITNIFRNIIRINIGKEFTMGKMKVDKDVHSTPQLIMTINAPSQEVAAQFILDNEAKIQAFFSSEELNRAADDIIAVHCSKFTEQVQKMFGLTMYIPSDIKEMKIGKNFIWASDNGDNAIQNVAIYSLPFNKNYLNQEGYIEKRDSAMKANIPGYDPSHQWMQTNGNFVWTKLITVKGVYAMEARGLWEIKDDAMGGPFVAHNRIDSVNNRIIVVEGFVYAPNKMKRTMMRRLEAALYTLDVPSPNGAATKEEKK